MPEPDSPDRRWLRILGKLLLGSLLAVFLYVLSLGPIFYLLAYRWRAVDNALWYLWYPIDCLQQYPGSFDYLAPYYDWWSELPGGIIQRLEQHPERLGWWMENDTPNRERIEGKP